MRAELVLPFPPSMNTYWRTWNGRTLLSKAGRQYKTAVYGYCLENRVPKFGEQRVKFSMVLRPKDKRQRDIDNYAKAVLDALQYAGIIEDDWQVDHLEMIRGEPVVDGCVQVTIETYPTSLP